MEESGLQRVLSKAKTDTGRLIGKQKEGGGAGSKAHFLCKVNPSLFFIPFLMTSHFPIYFRSLEKSLNVLAKPK